MRRRLLLVVAVTVGLLSGALFVATPLASATPAWSIVPSASPPAASTYYFTGVACPSVSDCFAVGYDLLPGKVNQPIAEQWNGASWAITATPSPSLADGVLFGVACATTTNCTAVGFASNSVDTVETTLVEHWDGTTWSIAASPNPAGSPAAELGGVSCPTATSCIAVGFDLNTTHKAVATLIERWDGASWTIAPSKNRGGGAENALEGVSCPTATSCTAVGASPNSRFTAGKTLVEHWNGKTWTIMSSPNPTGLPNALLSAVSCPSVSACFAVGGVQNGSGTVAKTVAERWTGKSWSIVPSANPTKANAYFSGVSCTTTANCTAVGYDGHAGIWRWNGKSWTIVPSPINADGQPLNAVSCPTTTNCVAGGGRGLAEVYGS